MAKETNISDKELDRDITNLTLPESDISPEDSIDSLSFYSDDMKKRLKEKLSNKKD